MKAEKQTFRLSDRLAVEFTLGGDGVISAAWTPDLPKRLTADEAVAYRNARNEMLGRLAARLGVAVVCVDA